MTTEEFAQTLIERFNSMRPAFGDRRLHQIFLGAKDSVANYPEDVRHAYDLAEKELFPQTPVTTSEPVFNGDRSKPEPEQTPMKPKNPTPEALYRAWEDGGEAKLGELLEQMTDEDDE